LTIIAFWLGTTGWLLWRDLWPSWRSGEPPPYTIDLVEEVQRGRDNTVLWAVLDGDHEVMQARSWVEHRADDTFVLRLDFKPRPAFGKPAGLLAKRHPVSSMLRVTRDGSLCELEVRAAVEEALGRPLAGEVLLAGQVRGERFYPHLRVECAGQVVLDSDLRPVEVSYHGSVLVPSHPVNRIQGLRPGQSWRMPEVDPFAAGLGLTDAVRQLNARVLPEPRVLEWRGKSKTCLVIEYEGADEKASTWVEVGSGLVQRQEAAFGGSRLVLQRDD
jgi:hypothetical protein